MPPLIISLAFLCSLPFCLAVFVLICNARVKNPPSPPKWPVLGHLPLLGDLPHRTLFHLSKKYGPLMTIDLGLKRTLVVSSPAAAKEVLHENDLIFSSRSTPTKARIFSYGGTSLVWAPYDEHWKFLRRISTTEIFSAKRLESMESLRREEVRATMASIFHESHVKGDPINVRSKGFQTMLGLTERMIYSKKMTYLQIDDAVHHMQEMVGEVLEMVGRPSLSDAFPFLGVLDRWLLSRKVKRLSERFDQVFDKAIEEHQLDRKSCRSKDADANQKDFLQVLLEIKLQNAEFKMEYIKGMLMDMFIAGTETSSSAVEWALAELLKHPDAMAKVQGELDLVVGEDRMMEERDIPNLPYLQAVLKETLRLHPPAPLSVPRQADADCKIGGFHIKKGTQVMVNIWGIGRSESVWREPTCFRPERFTDNTIDFKGKDFEFIPFGSGRRICIGMPLASKMVPFILGSLVQCFHWEVEGSEVDFEEGVGISLKKVHPLVARAKPRLKGELYQ